MKKLICNAFFALVVSYVGDAAAVECNMAPMGGSPVDVPFSHTLPCTDDAFELQVGDWIWGQMAVLIGFECGIATMVPQMPDDCTFAIKFNDGWRANAQNMESPCIHPWLVISNCQQVGGNGGKKSPILLDLDRNQFHLSEGPVNFDIDADWVSETVAWTSAGELDGFLYLDRNGNGVVDDGSELFGDATLLESGEVAQNGYQALADFDLLERGGIEDGVIDPLDLVFADLRVWVDANADGTCELHETLSLVEAGVLEIELEYIESPRIDQHGNEFRYISRGLIEVNGKAKEMWTTDVFFNSLGE